MNIFTVFAQRFGSVSNAVQFLKMNGIQITATRYREWTEGKITPKREILDLVMRSAIEHLYGELKEGVSLSGEVQEQRQNAPVVIVLKRTIPVDELRRKLPHRRFGDDYWQRVRLVDAQVLEAVHGHDVWTRFERMCGNFNNALYVLRRACTGRRITADWLHNRITSGWYPDTVNAMVDLLNQYEGTGTPFTAMSLSQIREQVRQFIMLTNPGCDFDAMPDDVVMQLWKDMKS
ncbi:hypothetical protein NW995_002465 [Salmonella enterica]|nr:hypothetical protein [Salmonella enterica]